MSNLYQASREWSERPADQRFSSLEELHNACVKNRKESGVKSGVLVRSLQVEPSGEDLRIVSTSAANPQPASFTHWSFGQLCQRVGAVSNYLRRLPAKLASDCLNHGLQHSEDPSQTVQIMARANGHLRLTAITGDGYSRIWNSEITQRLFGLRDAGWVVPPARPAIADQPGSRIATEADCIKQPGFALAIKPGDLIAPAGLYASDRDLFAFFVNPNRVVKAPGVELFRGTFISNSEVGDKAFRITNFLFSNVCGNHIVWDVSGVSKIAIRHVGNADARAWQSIHAELVRYADSSTEADELKIAASARYILGNTKEEVLDALFKAQVGPTRQQLTAAYTAAEAHVRTDSPGVGPRTAWGFAQGLTRLSQQSKYADERTALDAAAGKVVALAF